MIGARFSRRNFARSWIERAEIPLLEEGKMPNDSLRARKNVRRTNSSPQNPSRSAFPTRSHPFHGNTDREIRCRRTAHPHGQEESYSANFKCDLQDTQPAYPGCGCDPPHCGGGNDPPATPFPILPVGVRCRGYRTQHLVDSCRDAPSGRFPSAAR